LTRLLQEKIDAHGMKVGKGMVFGESAEKGKEGAG
jgi:hypothetical protein